MEGIVIPRESQDIMEYKYFVDEQGNLCKEFNQKIKKEVKGGKRYGKSNKRNRGCLQTQVH